MSSSSSSSSVVLVLSILFLLSPTAFSSCKKQKFKTPNKNFSSCMDLPKLSGDLHYTFNASSSTLSMAFTAEPSGYLGWISWAINPNASGMVGSQALLAYYNSSSHSITVDTYNLSSYRNFSRSNISYNVSGIAAEYSHSGGTITIFATWQLPNGTSVINQVWQVGPFVTNGFPAPHKLHGKNLKSMYRLNLTAPPPEPHKNGAGEGVGRVGVWMGLVLAILLLLV